MEAVERLLGAQDKLHKFERAQLGTHPSIHPSIHPPIHTSNPIHALSETNWDIVSLGSLCCETSEEAKYLIPSLSGKMSDDDLQEILDEMYKLMHR